MQRLPKKLLVSTPVAPPDESGHAVVLGRMFGDIDPRDYELVTFSRPRGDAAPDLPTLSAKIHYLQSTRRAGFIRAGYPLAAVRSTRRFLGEAVFRGRRLARIIRTDNVGALLVTSSGGPDPAAALIASWLTGVPLIFYMLDEWRHLVSQDRALGPIANVLQWRVIAGSTGVIVANQWLGESLDNRYGCHCVLVGNPLAPGALGAMEAAHDEMAAWPANPGEIRMVFSGQVYPANLDAIERVTDAIQSPGLESVRLDIYTGSKMARELIERGRGRVRVRAYVGSQEIHLIQRQADILLMPLAFDPPFPELIRTAAPTKFGEYLASGRPIFVHAPADSFPAVFTRAQNLGEVVDRPNSELVAAGIRRIIEDRSLREQRQRRAIEEAWRSYSPAATTGRFAATLQSMLGERSGQPR